MDPPGSMDFIASTPRPSPHDDMNQPHPESFSINRSAHHADRVMLPLLWVLFATSLGLAPWHDTWTLALLVGLPLALVPTALILWLPGHKATRVTVAVVFMLFCALQIHQSMGTIELHFGIFVLLAVLLCYRDWSVILIAAAVVALHHLSFNTLQTLGYPTYCFTQPGLGRVLAHAAYVVVEAGFLCYIAHWMRKDARQADELTQMVSQLMDAGQIRLALSEQAPASPAATVLYQVLQAIAAAVANVQAQALSIDQALGRLRDGNETVSQGADHQADAIAQAVESIRALTDSLSADRERTESAEQAVLQTTVLAQEGSRIMRQSVDSMHAMETLSRQIEDITTLIDGIAFQTNILALNASVEAARAGVHGRGFAVVAGEVRTLAQRSAEASQQIRKLISSSSQQVGEGTALIERSGGIMQQLAEGVQGLSHTLSQFLQANRDQGEQILELEQSMSQVQTIAQDNLREAQDAEEQVQQLGLGARRLRLAVGRMAV
ncbi:methyl-accepting chemotaxis protein [Castellaniella caeni]|uniref:methyl-accepting chemotaxis protein n=1 Tax=Castellaniella caeni TaxID=266123 RepID=UPI00083085B5|nr:methyl-accepting chemotaxis protein [Castellaniella caeni]